MAKKSTLTVNQNRAANPDLNVWVQANAGTGKTSVLVQRLLRILFRNDGMRAPGILCLTYTKAGAGEMRNRILAALRDWAMASDDELADLLDGVALQSPITSEDIEHARTIFFRYIDNPDILNIKTIHGFCEEILHRFPIEAGISPSWTVIPDDAQRALLHDVFSKMFISSQGGDDKKLARAFERIVERTNEQESTMNDLLKKLSGLYKDFCYTNNIIKYRKYFIEKTLDFLQLNNDENDGFSVESLQNIIKIAEMQKNKPAFMKLIVTNTEQYINNTINFDEYKKTYLKTDGTLSKNALETEFVLNEATRVYHQNQRRLNKIVFDDTMALFDLAAAFAEQYRTTKQAAGLLDYDDLLFYTQRLFSNPQTMGWILSQLNVKLGNILVDEAQDTSPQQWDLICKLVENDDEKSVFIVGDKKQSIYAFQGADPNAFENTHDYIYEVTKQNMRELNNITLADNFRSLPEILSTVDYVFSDTDVINVSKFQNNPHRSFRDGSGAVEIHKMIDKRAPEGTNTIQSYVTCIADKIQEQIEHGTSPGDIMVLVRNREPFAPMLLKELKSRDIDIAGSDSIKLPQFPAIRDLLNLTRFCLDVTDDYSLCCVLKSPIFRMTERDIFDICQVKNTENDTRRAEYGNEYSPMTVLDVLADTRPDVYTCLGQIIEWSKKLSPYSFFTNVLNANNTRGEFISALGPQVIEPLEEFLTICLSYERTRPGTLRHFLKYFVTSDIVIKRTLNASMGVRVVTVHASKGLESKVVFLIDTVRKIKRGGIVDIPVTHTNLGPNAITPHVWTWTAREKENGERSIVRQDIDKINTDIDLYEYFRLLYVAMTRARDRLYIYGFATGGGAQDIDNSWHTHLWRVMGKIPGAKITDETIRIGNDK